MLYVATLKVYKEIDDDIEKLWYCVRNAEEVLKLSICSGDIIDIVGLGKLEVFSVDYESREVGKNPYKSLLLTCGVTI